jgi:hypothetical protein
MLQPEDLLAAGLTALSEDDDRLQPPDQTTAAPVDPQLQLLPTELMHWTQFERLLLRVAREVRGLRSVSLLGDSGQKQEGLDVIGLDGAGEAEGIQSKRYVKFTKADLDAAVKKFDEGSLPFPVPRVDIGVACSGHEAKVVARLIEINQDRDDLEVEIWDRERLSEMLRDRPEIVREFFGAATAASFCVPHIVEPVVVPAPDAVSLATAVLAGPVSATGALKQLSSRGRGRASGSRGGARTGAGGAGGTRRGRVPCARSGPGRSCRRTSPAFGAQDRGRPPAARPAVEQTRGRSVRRGSHDPSDARGARRAA